MQKNATIYDIAKALGVTTSTVSRALNNSSLISVKTREKVKQMAAQLHYRPNKMAASLSSGISHSVGIIIPSAKIQFFSSIITSLEQQLQKSGYHVLLYQSNESSIADKNGVRALLEAQVDGILISPSLETYDFDFLRKAYDGGLPIIQFDRTDKSLNIPSVRINDEAAGYMATKHLIDMGYRRIAYVSTKSTIQIFEDRYAGYLRALTANGLNFREDYVLRDELSIEGGIRGVQKLMHLPVPPDAIIGGDDFTALGIIKALSEMNLTPPKIGVVGFANQTFSEFITPSLTTIDQQAYSMGQVCAQLLFDILGSKSLPNEDVQNIVIEPLLIERVSSRKSES